MTVLSYKGYATTVELDLDDNILVGRLIGIDDVIGFHAEDLASFVAAFHEAVDDYVETCAKVGKTPQKPYSGNVMFRIDPGVHARAVLAAKVSGKSLNAWGESVLRVAADQAMG
ncbi:type II toxin-antitoxin system HicB family antitoxin [Sphingomonas sp. UYP23]